jgi:hypothetical protein
MTKLLELRQKYLEQVCQHAIFWKSQNVPSIADVGSPLSKSLSWAIIEKIGFPVNKQNIKGQTAGKGFEEVTRDFLQEAFTLLAHLRPGNWQFSVQGNISSFEQYQHLAELNDLVKSHKQLQTALGDYVVKPDIVVARIPVTDKEINQSENIVDNQSPPTLTPLRLSNSPNPLPILHASISCKLTLRSDRSQNARTEGLNLIRNRKGHTPHIAVVTAEPMPTRIASLALGTGDIDCVYHFALPELAEAALATQNEAVIDSLMVMVEGRRLRDIADLPFDLAI